MSHDRARRVVRGALWTLAAAHLVEAAVLRRRRERVAALSNPGVSHDLAGKLGVTSAEGAEVDDGTIAAAAHEMELDGVDVVDLVPGDLSAERSLRLLRRVEPERLPDDVMYTPGGAHEVLALHPSLVERMGIEPREESMDRSAMVRRTVKAQRYAPTSAVLRVAPGLRSAPYGPLDRWRELEGLTVGARPYASLPPVLVGAQLAHLAALAAGVVVAPVPALAALAAWSAQPSMVFGGGEPEARALQPPEVTMASVLRFPRALLDALRTAAVGYRETRAAAERRLAEPLPATPSLDELFEDRREHCPWCGSPSIVGRIDTTDVFQNKPGTFHVDECTDCGHIFQNPAPTDAGLDYYYADFYEGIGEELWEVIFAGGAHHSRNRVEAIARVAEPKTWLDVGAGHGHFCLTARQRWPETRFDGVDMSETVEEAGRRGRIDTAYRGLFTELADELPRNYDVVSMHHYLEHTRDPRRELAAAAELLAPGGHLMIEVPDPSTPWARRLGRFWYYWAQPQHLHLVRCEELVAHLEAQGFEVVSVERAAATLGFDLTGAAVCAAQTLAPSSHLPWFPPPTLSQRLKRTAVVAAAVPVVVAAAIVDTAKDARPTHGRVGNAYRVVARAGGGADG